MRAESGGPCYLEIEFTLRPGKRREFAKSVEELIGNEGEGHIKSTVFEDREEPGHMIWIESWSSRQSVETYLLSEQFGVLIGGLRVLSSGTRCQLIDEAERISEPGATNAQRVQRVCRATRIQHRGTEADGNPGG